MSGCNRSASRQSGRSGRVWAISAADRVEQRTVTKRNSYAPYGEAYAPTAIDGTGYTGHVMDQATGLTYMQQRYYDPQIGRFLSRDPVAANAGTGFNRYNYANNNPYRFTDPDGRRSKDCGDSTCYIPPPPPPRPKPPCSAACMKMRATSDGGQSGAGAQMREENAQALATSVQASATGAQALAFGVGASVSGYASAVGHSAEFVAEGLEAGKYVAKRLGIIGAGFAWWEVVSPNSSLLDRGHGVVTLAVGAATTAAGAPLVGVGYSALDISVQARYGGWFEAGGAGAVAAPGVVAAFPTHPMQNR